jgi:hypothetical protein
MEKDAIEVDSIERIGLPDITPEQARESGFLGVLDLLKVAKHGRGENIYLVRFHYVRPETEAKSAEKSNMEGRAARTRTYDANCCGKAELNLGPVNSAAVFNGNRL